MKFYEFGDPDKPVIVALLIKPDKYADTVSDYIMERSEQNGIEKHDK